MRSRKDLGFTLIELLVVISIIALLIGILLPALGAARRTARQMENNAQCRGIHQSMVMFAQGNKSYFPGVQATGRMIPDDGSMKSSGTGDHPRVRFEVMFIANYFAGEYAVSPAETKDQWSTAEVESRHYSYAMQEFLTTGAAGNEILDESPRSQEWRETLNTESPIMGDRNDESGTDTDASDNEVKSIWTTEEGDWRGTVTWNDNHTKFESTHLLDVQMGDGPSVKDDNLFNGDEDGKLTSNPSQDSPAADNNGANFAYEPY